MQRPGSPCRLLEATKLQVGEALFFIYILYILYTVLGIFLYLLPGSVHWDKDVSAVDQSDHVYIPKHTMNNQFRLSEGS